MHPSRTRRWILMVALLAAAYAGLRAYPRTQVAQAAPALPSAAAHKVDDNSPPPGVDLSKLDEFERKVFYRVITRETSACGQGHSLIYSLKHDSACRASFYAVRYVAHLVDSGF